jgi:hypothetical protein
MILLYHYIGASKVQYIIIFSHFELFQFYQNYSISLREYTLFHILTYFNTQLSHYGRCLPKLFVYWGLQKKKDFWFLTLFWNSRFCHSTYLFVSWSPPISSCLLTDISRTFGRKAILVCTECVRWANLGYSVYLFHTNTLFCQIEFDMSLFPAC